MKPKTPIKRLNFEKKREIIRKWYEGKKNTSLSEEYGVSLNTINNVVKNRSKFEHIEDKWKREENMRRLSLNWIMEDELYSWVLQSHEQNVVILDDVIREKACEIYEKVCGENNKFEASDEWFLQFKEKDRLQGPSDGLTVEMYEEESETSSKNTVPEKTYSDLQTVNTTALLNQNCIDSLNLHNALENPVSSESVFLDCMMPNTLMPIEPLILNSNEIEIETAHFSCEHNLEATPSDHPNFSNNPKELVIIKKETAVPTKIDITDKTINSSAQNISTPNVSVDMTETGTSIHQETFNQQEKNIKHDKLFNEFPNRASKDSNRARSKQKSSKESLEDIILPCTEFPTDPMVVGVNTLNLQNISTNLKEPEVAKENDTIPTTQTNSQNRYKLMVEIWPQLRTEFVEVEENCRNLADKRARNIDRDWDDDVATFAANVRLRLRSFDPQQKSIAKKLIADILFMAETKQLQLMTNIVY